MEEYDGISILATNFKQNVDEAFLRRIHFSVDFPFPDIKQRILIWKSMFPKAAPLKKDIDFEFMAEKFVLAGGNIKNIALNSAFFAAQCSDAIGMRHIMQAARDEYKKIGKTFLKLDFEPYCHLVDERRQIC
jgi:ATP-dependent 26S proteasome regulatory subunit